MIGDNDGDGDDDKEKLEGKEGRRERS